MMSTETAAVRPNAPARTPPALVRCALGMLAYFGGLGLLAVSAARALVRPRGPAPRLAPTVVRHVDELFCRGLPLVALVFIPMGSFLSMQAFFNATFTEAVGAVVGLGLLRNLAPLLAGMILAALLAVRIVPELRPGVFTDLDAEEGSVPDRDVVRGVRPDDRPAPEPARLATVRMLAAAIVAPVLAVWGTLIGVLIGMVISQAKLGVSLAMFLGKLGEMLLSSDPVSLVAKSATFGMTAALIACHEGFRPGSSPREVADGTYRAVCLSLLAMLVINACWFTLEYLSGPPFGPSLALQ